MSEAKEVKSYKSDSELNEKLEALFRDSGMDTQGHWIEAVASLYEMQLLKEGMPDYRKTLDELEHHSTRIHEIFLGMAAERLSMGQEHDELLIRRNQEQLVHQAEISELNNQLQQTADALARLTKESADQAKHMGQLTEIARKDGLLIEEYRQKIDTMSGLLNEYKATADEINELKTDAAALAARMGQEKMRADDLQAEVQALQEMQANTLRQQEEKHKETLERLSERKDIEKERELLALRTECQTKLEKAHDDATAKMHELYEQRQMQEKQIGALTAEIASHKSKGK